MKASFKLDNRSSYLDVTEFIFKECSPLLKPTSPKQNLHDQVRMIFFCIFFVFLQNFFIIHYNIELVGESLSICFHFFCFIIIRLEIWENSRNKSNWPWCIKIHDDSFVHWALWSSSNRYFRRICVIKCWRVFNISKEWRPS